MARNYKTGVTVTGNADGAVKSLKATRSELDKLNKTKNAGARTSKTYGKSISQVSGLLRTLVPVATVAGLTSVVSSTLRSADAIGKMSARIGASTKSLSEYRHVAELSGVTFKQLTIGWQRQTRRIAEAAQGTGEAKDAIKELGLEAEALNRLSPDKQFEAIAKAMEGVDNQADRVRLAMKLWDSEGVSLLQTMEGGATAIADMRQEARDLGRSLSEDQVSAAEAANDAFTRLSGAAGGFSDMLVLSVAPALTETLTAILDIARADNVFETLISKIGGYFHSYFGEKIPTALDESSKKITALTEEAFKIQEIMSQLDAEGQAGGVLYQAYARKLEAVNKHIAKARKLFEKVNNQIGDNNEKVKQNTGVIDENTDSRERNTLAMDDGLEAMESLLFSLDKTLAAEYEHARTLDELHSLYVQGIIPSLEEYNRLQGLAEDRLQNATRETKTLTKATSVASVEVNVFADAWNEAGQRIDSAFAQLWQDGLDGFESFKDSLIDSFKSMLSELAHQAITRPILVQAGIVGGGMGASASASASTAVPYNSATGEYDWSSYMGSSINMASGSGSGFLSSPYLGTSTGAAVGAAGALGGMAAGAIWDGEHASTGGMIGGSAGMAIASAASLAGPYGVILAAAAALLGGYLGDKMSGSPNATYFNDADGIAPVRNSQRFGDPRRGPRYRPWEDDVFSRGAFGTLGLSNIGSSDIDAEEMRAALEGVTAIDDAISDAFGPEATRRVKAALDGWSQQDNQADDFATSMQNRMSVIIEALDFEFAELAQMAELGAQSLEDMTERLFLLKEIEDYIESSPLEGYTDAIAESQKTLRDRLAESRSEVARLGLEFDGTTDTMQALAQGVRERYQLELQYLNQIHQVQESLNSSIAGSVENIRLSVMTSEQQYDYFTEQAESLAATISTLTDPTEINDVVGRVESLTNRAYGLLDQGQRGDVSGEFIDFLEGVMEQANSRLDSARDEAVADSERFRTQIAQAVADGGEQFARHLEQSANIYRDASWSIHDAAYVWANNTQVTVDVHVDASQFIGAGDFANEVGYA